MKLHSLSSGNKRRPDRLLLLLIVFASLLTASPLSFAQFAQQGAKLVATNTSGKILQGSSVALSADGNIAVVGAPQVNAGIGAGYIYKRGSGGGWIESQQIVGDGAIIGITGRLGSSGMGNAVGISADGKTIVLAGSTENDATGAVWVFRENRPGYWDDELRKMVGTGAVGRAQQGSSVAISADGNTILVGGPGDDNNRGAAWVYVRSGDTWVQQGDKLVAAGRSQPAPVRGAEFGRGVALSADGNTALVGGPYDGAGGSTGAVWVFIRQAGRWKQQGDKLVAADGLNEDQGAAVALSGDGNTALVGTYTGGADPNGGAWAWVRRGVSWSQQGAKLVGTGAQRFAWQGNAVALSGDGNTAIIGGPGGSEHGGSWIFTRLQDKWTQLGERLIGSDGSSPDAQGSSVALSRDASTALIGGVSDNNQLGAAWVFTQTAYTGVLASAPPLGDRPRPFLLNVSGRGTPFTLMECGNYGLAALATYLGRTVTLTGVLLPPERGGGLCVRSLWAP